MNRGKPNVDNEKRRTGAPDGNVNRVVHGMRSQRTKRDGLVHARLGRRFAAAYGHTNQLRKAIEQLVTQQYGEVSLYHRAKIQTIIRLEEGARALELAMRENPKMGAEELRSTRSMIATWSCQRDNVLADLLGKCPAKDPWASLDGLPSEGDSEPIQEAQRAPAIATANDSGNSAGDHDGDNHDEQ